MHKLRPDVSLRFHPFSHTPGTSLIIPGSRFKLRSYPAKLQIFELSAAELLAEIEWQLSDSVDQFTTSLDMEKGRVMVWMKTANGFFRIRLESVMAGEGIGLTAERTPKEGVPYTIKGEWQQREPNKTSLMEKEQLWIGPSDGEPPLPPFVCKPLPRLSLGVSKKQDWDLVTRRQQAQEILPFWLRMGGLVPHEETLEGSGGTLALLEEVRETVESGSREEITSAFMRLFVSGFHGILCPHLEDGKALGRTLPPLTGEASPLTLLTEGSRQILKLFLSVEKNSVAVLPRLPSDFHSGRLINASLGEWGELDLEFRKKDPRRLALRPQKDGELNLVFPPAIKSFRIRKSTKDRGATLTRDQPIHLVRGEEIFLDHFLK